MDAISNQSLSSAKTKISHLYLIRSFFSGLLLPLGFAPFHFPGLAILGIALLFAELKNKTIKQSILVGFSFGCGFMGLGISWIYISIHSYGHLNIALSVIVTTLFIFYLAIFFASTMGVYQWLTRKAGKLYSCFLFSSTWCLGEYLRAECFSGFPWLLVGFGQIDTPLRYLLPIIGVYGVSFLTCLAATFLIYGTKISKQKLIYLIAFIAILLLPLTLKSHKTSTIINDSVSVGVVQANLSMRDKWDEELFLKLLDRYLIGINQLLKQAKVIVLPESAIPVPEIYIPDFIENINKLAKKNHNTFLIGIPETSNNDENYYYNTLSAFGLANGKYYKQHLVPFGEYIPKPFIKIAKLFNIPDANMLHGAINQPLIMVDKYPIATLICFEVAYPNLLRKQLPEAKWIVSISDDGWFGHSLAIYQQQQMSQVLSILTGRYQLIANNDGLSSIIDNKGNIISSLQAFSSENLYGIIKPATGASTWVLLGDKPFLFLSILMTIIALFRKRLYP